MLTAIRRQIESRSSSVDSTVARRELTLGSEYYTRRDLEELRDSGQMVELRVLGLASIADDVSPELALATIAADKLIAARLAADDVNGRCESTTTSGNSGRRYTRTVHHEVDRIPVAECWIVHGGGHAWYGGSPAGSYTDSQGPDAST